MKTITRVVFSLLSAAIGIAVALCLLCLVLSSNGLHASFVTKAIVEIGPLELDIFMFHPMRMLSWLMEGKNLSSAYMASPLLFTVPFAAGGLAWILLTYVMARIFRLMANKKTTLHGSSRWATAKELKAMGLMGNTGVVLGQTYDAVYSEKQRKRPRRNPGESAEDFRDRKAQWAPGIDYRQKTDGKMILQSGNAHMLIVGSTRSGKGISCIIPTEFRWPESIIIFDPKAEGWDVSANFRSRFSYTFKFQPEKPSESIHYNPLLSIRRGVATMPDIQNLCLSLIALNEQSKDPFWDNEARKLLAAVIGYVIYCMPPDRKTFKEVYSIFTAIDPDLKAMQEARAREAEENDEDLGEEKSPVQQRLEFYAENTARYIDRAREGMMMDDELKDQYLNRYSLGEKRRKEIEKAAEGRLMEEDLDNLDRIRQDLEYFSNCEQRQLSSVVSTMMSNLAVIADPNVQAVTDRSDFTMEDFVDGILDSNGKRRPISLYLCMSLASMQRLMPIMKIFYEQAITLLTRELKKRPYRLLLIFDEFRQMGKMDIVEKALALSAGYGILCMIAVQSYDQLKTIYQSDALFTDNFAYQVVLRVNDNSTCKKVEEILGQETRKHVKMNSSGNLGQIVHRHESLDTQELGRSLMTAEEVRTMPENECLVISSGMHPYKAKKIRYYNDKRFTPYYRESHGKGKMLPAPSVDDNYPHPEAITRDKKGNIVSNEGLDREGWHLLLGFKSDASALGKAGLPKTSAGTDDRIIEDSTNEPGKAMPIGDVDDMDSL